MTADVVILLSRNDAFYGFLCSVGSAFFRADTWEVILRPGGQNPLPDKADGIIAFSQPHLRAGDAHFLDLVSADVVGVVVV